MNRFGFITTIMKQKLLPAAIILLIAFNACNLNDKIDTGTIATDSTSIAKGSVLFNKNCSGCHNFLQDGIGPQLGGLTTEVATDWITHFIGNPQQVITSGDERAAALYKKYKVAMPSFAALGDTGINAVIAFLHTHKKPLALPPDKNGTPLTNPIPDTIQRSNLVVQLQQVAQFPASSDSGKLPLARITKLDHQPGTGNLFVLDLRGKLYSLQQNKPVLYMDMAKLQKAFINEPGLATGFGSFAFHPEFLKNGLLYTTHTEAAGTAKADFGYADSIKVTLQWVLTEWKVDNPTAKTFTGKGRELLRINMVSPIHGVQEITFNPLAKQGDEDYGLLYAGIGEGGCVENGYAFLAHNKATLYGTVIRINPSGNNSRNGKYGIPVQNPFANDPAANGEIYAYGFRNPHRITWTSKGEMLVSNVGHGNIESVNLIAKGHDYGWPIREGNFLLNPYGDLGKVYALPANDSSFHITYPVAEYDHGEGKAISGGYEYTGNAIPALKGKYLFGDIPTGRLFYIDVNDIQQGKQATIKEWRVMVNGKEQPLRAVCGSDRVDLHFGRDAAGEMYIMTKADGRLYKLTGAVN